MSIFTSLKKDKNQSEIQPSQYILTADAPADAEAKSDESGTTETEETK